MLIRWTGGRATKPGFATNDGDGEREAWWALGSEAEGETEKVILGTPFNDVLHGRPTDDEIDGGPGADRMAGRGGDDTYYVDNTRDVVRERAHEGIDTVVSQVSWTLGKHVENLSLGSATTASLVGTGNSLNNVIKDSYGSNVLYGMLGNDTLLGGHVISPGSHDTLYGGDGNDLLEAGLFDYSGDQLHGGNGNDTLSVTQGSNGLYGEEGDDHLVAGSGGTYHGPSDKLDGGAGQDTLEGGSFMDGGDGDDTLLLDGVYTASGGDGNDNISGTGGVGYSNADVDGGAGDDTIDVSAPINRLTIDGGDGNDSIIGGGWRDVTLDGGAGDDVVTAHQWRIGPTTLYGGEGNDVLSATGGGTMTLDGGLGDDHLSVVLSGSFTTATLTGGEGNDTLSASHGMDTLAGGIGNDVFLLSASEILWQDMVTVTDFESGVDQLSVSQATLAVGNGDAVVDHAQTIDGPGGFDACAELVIVAADIFGDLTLDAAAAAIGSANQAYTEGQTVLFMVDNGTDSMALRFTSSGADAVVSAAELSVVARLDGSASTAAEDIVWSA